MRLDRPRVAHPEHGPVGVLGGDPQQARRQGITQTLDCNTATVLVNGTSNTIYAKGSCWAVTLQGSSNIVVADTKKEI